MRKRLTLYCAFFGHRLVIPTSMEINLKTHMPKAFDPIYCSRCGWIDQSVRGSCPGGRIVRD